MLEGNLPFEAKRSPEVTLGANAKEASTVMKRVIALGMLVLGVTLISAPGAGADTCPPGTTDDPYCTPAITIVTNNVKVGNNGVLTIPLRCATKPRCVGKLILVTGGGKARASAVATASATVGSSRYSINYNRTSRVRVGLSQRGRTLLGRTGRLRVAVVSVSQGERTTLGTVTLRGRRYVTGIKGTPGFTG